MRPETIHIYKKEMLTYKNRKCRHTKKHFFVAKENGKCVAKENGFFVAQENGNFVAKENGNVVAKKTDFV